MPSIDLVEKAAAYLHRLCLEIPNRRVGSPGNRAATAFFAERMAAFGYQTECPEFDCMDWIDGGARLQVNDHQLEVFASPYSLGCQVIAPFVVVSSVAELERVEAAGAILLLRGEIAKEQLMPKNFPFYNPDEHQRIIHLLETKRPQAIIAATGRNPDTVGGIYPCPLIEDGDFDIPSVYMSEEEGIRLAKFAGKQARLDSQAQRLPATGCNVIARKGATADRRVVFTAHIDARYTTPGALDNASGVVTLLLLAELLAGYDGRLGVEMVAINGEDYYANPGEIQYLSLNQGKLGEILLNINIDDVGYHQGNTSYSLYELPDELAGRIRTTFSSHPDMVAGERWFQGDHMIFVLNQVPALAITSQKAMEVLHEITHTPRDTPELVDPEKLANLAVALRELLLDLDQLPS